MDDFQFLFVDFFSNPLLKTSQQLLKAARTLKRFPKTDPEALEEQFPDVKYSEVTR